jgi:AmmeMemoRadiSam system protein B
LRKSQTIAVFGGHLGYADTILCARDSAFQTPSGDLETDIELLAALESELRDSGYGSLREDVRTDNSVEVLLPMLPILHPGAKILWLRSPPRPVAKEVGAALGRAAAVLGRSVSCIGSTDLTHYGPAYGFTPQGTDSKAVRWVRETNDASFISALLDMNCETALSMGIRKGSACSPGAAVSALSFALESGATSSRLIEYSTSLEVVASPSFVGYAAMSFEP